MYDDGLRRYARHDRNEKSPARRMHASKLAPLFNSSEVVAIQVHHLAPRSREVFHELLLGVVTGVDFRDGPKLGVRTEDKVDTGAGPLEFARRAIAPFKHAFGCGGSLPLRIH